MTSEHDPGLFELTNQPPSDAPLCRRCRINPVPWGPRTKAWRTYCGGSLCTSTHRKCMHCQAVVHVDDFRYSKYCSHECAYAAAQATGRPPSARHTCLRCGATSTSQKPSPHGWRDGRCSNCWRTRIGNDRMKSMVLHHVPWDLADHWAQTGWHCDLCSQPVSIKAGVIDHDHDCCPGGRSCGKCVRGYLHSNCNIALGYLNNDPDLLRAAADYLERTSTRRTKPRAD